MSNLRNWLFCRILPITLAASLFIQPALAASQPQIPSGWSSPFSDVKAGQWFYPFVASLNSQGVIHGYDDGRFGPNDTTRAGDAMIMILKAAGSGTLEPLQDTHYATSYALYAVEQGWLAWEEIPSLTGPVSRLFIAQLAAKALGLSPAADVESPFEDTDDPYVIALYQNGIIAGNQVGDQLLFKPDSSITRAEVSAIVWQVQEYASYIHFNGQTLNILDNVPLNAYRSASFALEGDRMTYTQADMKTALGVDVSSYQGTINWKNVAKDGVDFAMIRAGGRYYGSGDLFEDTRFRANVQGASNAGLTVGVYFFSQATTPEEAREEAEFLLERLEDYDITGPVAFDWENITYDTARTDSVDNETLTAIADTFCRTIVEAGYTPMIYFNQYLAYLRYDLSQLTQYPFWLAQYGETPSFRYHFHMWQYSEAGQVDGIQGKVDLNLLFLPQ